ncbi:MAG: PAS domain S-box protein [Methylococcaceae bacterium]|nr:PAS domain S-box protein [Methylococcaceae bacterium]
MPTDHDIRQPQSNPFGRYNILAVVLVYAIFAACWILMSDRWVQLIFNNPEQIILASIIKGWLFVAVTSWLLYALMRRWVGGNPPPQADIDNSRRLKQLFVLLGTGVIALTLAGIIHTYKNVKSQEVSRLKAIANLKTGHIADWLRERQGNADFVRNSAYFSELYRHWRESGDKLSGLRLQIELEQFRSSQGFDAVTLLTPDAEKLWGSDKSPQAIAPTLQAEARRCATERQVRHIGPYRDLAGRERLDFIAPLATVPGSAPLVVLHVNPENWFFPTLRTWPVSSVSGEALLFRRDGDQLLYLTELRHRKAAPSPPRLPIATENQLAARVLRGEITPGESLAEGTDYRGVQILAAIYPVTGSDWFLMTKLDRSELYTKAFGEADWISFTGMLALLMTAAAFFLLRQRQQLASIQTLQRSQAERLRALSLLEAIADCSNDAIFAKDIEGRFILFNRAAANLVGKSADEVLGKDEYAVFPTDLAKELMEIGHSVIAENRIHTQEEILRVPGGERVCLTTKGPLRDANGRVIGLFGICRDITERKQAELARIESESRFRALVEQSLAGIYIIQDNRFRYINPAFAAIFGYRTPKALIDRVLVTDLIHPKDREEAANNIKRLIAGEVNEVMHYTFAALRRDGQSIYVEAHGRVIDYQGRPAVIGMVLDISARKASEETLRRQAEELSQRNAELERFNRATVGRELDMITLKQQINTLSVRLGREPPYPLSFLEPSPDQAKLEDTR